MKNHLFNNPKQHTLSLHIAIILAALWCYPSSEVRAQVFTKITGGVLSTDVAASRSVNWIDYDGDGNLDVFVSRGKAGGQNNIMYKNDGAPVFSFTKMDTMVISRDNQPSDGSSWGDIDNDGNPDLFVVNWYNRNNMFYLNKGNNLFTRVTSGSIVTDGGYSETASWGDYNNDGLLDLYVTNSEGSLENFLYKNTGNGQFQRIIAGVAVNESYHSRGVNWIDYDNDGDLDIFVTNEGNENENLYKNMLKETGIDSFLSITTGDIVNSGGTSWNASWADCDNDGDVDVFVTNRMDQDNQLFLNDGIGNFTSEIISGLTTQRDYYATSAWFDYDNDGDVDLFITTGYAPGKSVNYLYRNTFIEDGTLNFERMMGEPTAADSGSWYGLSSGDYDSDGDLDLYVAGTQGENSTNAFYRNDITGKNWLILDCIGTTSNRSAIGAKVFLKATIGGSSVRQMRIIEGQSGYCGQNLQVHFGLNDAAVIDSLEIDWPSGLSETFTNVQVNQRIVIAEHDSAAPQPLYPNKLADEVAQGTTLRWAKSYYPAPYCIQVGTDSTFNSGVIINDSTVVDTQYVLPALEEDKRYFWRVRSSRSVYKHRWSELFSFVLTNQSIRVHYPSRWNLVAIPLSLEDTSAEALFNGALSPMYEYSNGEYMQRDTVTSGRGYWVKLPYGATYEFIGHKFYNDTIHVMEGWNLIGGVSEPIAVSGIQSNPPGLLTSLFYNYQSRYLPSDSVIPGRGYWVKTEQPGVLILNAVARNITGTIRAGLISELPPQPPEAGDSKDEFVPENFRLEQNYPNPFNPQTQIRYSLRDDGYVSLVVYNILGEQITTLIGEFQSAGEKSVVWDAAGLPSGIYTYRITAGNFTDTKKMILLR